jgi:hypothetical protein
MYMQMTYQATVAVRTEIHNYLYTAVTNCLALVPEAVFAAETVVVAEYQTKEKLGK